MRVEQHGLGDWSADLRRAGDEIVPEVRKVTAKTLLEMKRTAQRIVAGHPHLRHLGRSFSYDTAIRAGMVSGEVGADHARMQGPLDGLIENGTPRSAPIPHWRPAADEQVPLWHDYLDQAALEAIEARR